MVPQKILIPALDEKKVRIIYIPSHLQEIEFGTIVFTSLEIGSWRFKLRGKGLKPTKFPVQLIHGALNKEYTGNVNFKNPFKDKISVIISLEAERKRDFDAFSLLSKKKKLVLRPQSIS